MAHFLGWDRWIEGPAQFKDGDVLVSVTAPRPRICPKCGVIPTEGIGFHDKGSETRHYHDLPTGEGERRLLAAKVVRWQCLSCRKKFYPDYPELYGKRHVTARLVRHFLRWVWHRPFADLAMEYGCNEDLVIRLFEDHRKQLDEEHNPVAPERLAIDETMIGKSLRAVLTSHDGHLIDVLADAKGGTLMRRFEWMPGREKTQVVTMDQTPRYRDLIGRYFPHAVVVADKWHILTRADKTFGSLFSQYRQKLKRAQRAALWNDRALFTKHRWDLNTDEVLLLATWLDNHPFLKKAHELKEGFHAVYRCKERQEAEDALVAWMASITPEMNVFRETVAKPLKDWHEEYLNYFEFGRPTNAIAESVNRRIKDIRRERPRISFGVLRTLVIHKCTPHDTVRIDPKAEGWVPYEDRSMHSAVVLERPPFRPGFVSGSIVPLIHDRYESHGVPIPQFLLDTENGLPE